MPALTYGMPVNNKLLCSNPVCREYADWVVHTANGEVLVCAAHLDGVTQQVRAIGRLEKLIVAGERNKQE
jgi:hypothetical protein